MPSGIYKRTEKHNRKNSEARKGKKLSEEHKRHISESNKGYIMPAKQKKKISEANRGKKNLKHSEYMKGKNNPNYKHGLSYTKEYCRKKTKQWQKENRDKYNKYSSFRRAMKLNQTPILTELENEKILMYYKIRDYLGEGWQVDHIIPLSKGGLHHPDNLQIVTKEYNQEKHNKLNFRAPTALEYWRI